MHACMQTYMSVDNHLRSENSAKNGGCERLLQEGDGPRHDLHIHSQR